MGWKAHDSELLPGSATSYVIHEAATSFKVFAPDRLRPVEVGADRKQELLSWLTERLGSTVDAPRLAHIGFSLIGGRLIPTDSRHAVLGLDFGTFDFELDTVNDNAAESRYFSRGDAAPSNTAIGDCAAPPTATTGQGRERKQQESGA